MPDQPISVNGTVLQASDMSITLLVLRSVQHIALMQQVVAAVSGINSVLQDRHTMEFVHGDQDARRDLWR